MRGSGNEYLILVSFDELAKQTGTLNISDHRKIIDLKLLQTQADYFEFVCGCLDNLREAYKKELGKRSDEVPLPEKVDPLPLDNGLAPWP